MQNIPRPASVKAMQDDKIRVLDLFAGAGGFTAGLHAASGRFTTISAVEMDAAAAASYEATFGQGIVYKGPIERWLESDQLPTEVDLVVGGPPCQGFSLLGKQDEQDERNVLWESYARTLTIVQPRIFVLENVAAFAKSSQFARFQQATKAGGVLEDYSFQHQVLNAADFGAPQSRKRAVLIGHRRDAVFPGFPKATHSAGGAGGLRHHVTVGNTFAGVPIAPDMDSLLQEKRFLSEATKLQGPFKPREMHWGRSYRPVSLERFASIPPGGNRFNLPEHLKAPCWKKHTSGSGDVMGRLHLDRPSVTVRTEFFKPEKGRYLHPTADRAITHYEAALLQGFSEDHLFVGSRTAIARQIGNAVPVPLGQAIGLQLLQHFE
ncbi:DNA (cytosine-5)-methyltransferase 1 [Leucobacter luti]|uniref:Cytosine-specific methyltransferase n=2 Tax=Leucobacter luti TaxID=340320 RepID=A0A4R6S4R8_9MICO|nr:DNA (cytosine-5)-methyltransferase 1 [Leucobacter luti]